MLLVNSAASFFYIGDVILQMLLYHLDNTVSAYKYRLHMCLHGIAQRNVLVFSGLS